MLRVLLKFTAVLLAGPLLALAFLALGCFGQDPLLGVACGHNAPVGLAALSVVFWLLLLVVWSIRSAKRETF